MRLLLRLLILSSAWFAFPAHADSTISTDPVERVAYAANGGWINWRWDTGVPGEGATIGEQFCWGRIYSANLGWITLGDGAPADGKNYSQANGDIGLNHDGLGFLSGWAYAANFGWIKFANTWNNGPFLDLLNGTLSGRVYSANLGWIDLGSNGLVFVKTDTLAPGPDTDGDMIPDWWELEQAMLAGLATGTIAVDLMLLDKLTDVDKDGDNDLAEYLADTDPFDDQSKLRVTFYSYDEIGNMHEVHFTSSARRFYAFQTSPDLVMWTTEMDGITAFPPENMEMFTSLNFPAPPATYIQVIAKRPLQ